jgi:hypothetical protein
MNDKPVIEDPKEQPKIEEEPKIEEHHEESQEDQKVESKQF